MRRFLTLGLAALFLASPLKAQTASTNEAALAETLFREARELMQAERYSEACAKFEESQRLDPGGGTLLNLAVCHEMEGKTASAWAEFQEALAMARSDGRRDRVDLALEHIETLEPRLSKLTLVVAEDPPDGLTVSINSMNVGAAVWGSAVPVDPGEVAVRAEAPEHESFVKTVTVVEGEQLTVDIPPLVSAPSDGPTGETGEASGAAATPAGKTGAYVVGAVGLAAIGVGSYFGVRALQEKKKANANGCDVDCTTTTGHDADKNAVFNGWLSTAGFGVGIAALGVATYLYLDGDQSEETPPGVAKKGAKGSEYAVVPSVSERGASLFFSGSF